MKNLYAKAAALVLLLFTISAGPGRAQQIQGAELTYTIDAANPLLIHGTLTAYTDFSHTVPDNPDVQIYFGPDQRVSVERSRRSRLPDGYYKSTYLFDHTFPAAGSYPVSFGWQNRPPGLVNIPDSETRPYWITTQVVLDPATLLRQESAQFLSHPLQVIPQGQTVRHHLGAYDPEGDSLTFELVTSMAGPNTNASGYVLPDFVKLNAWTGEITYTNPAVAGAYALAVKVTEYRNKKVIATVMRDFTVMVKPPLVPFAQSLAVTPGAGLTITPQHHIFISPGQVLSLQALLQDEQADTTLYYLYSDLFGKTEKFQVASSFTGTRKSMHITLEADPALQRRAPYLIVLRAISRKDWDINTRDKEISQEKGYWVYIGSDIVNGLPGPDPDQGLRLFPNPATDVIYVDLPRYRPGLQLQVFTDRGQLVWQQPLLAARTPLRRQHLGAGKYLYTIVPLRGYENKAAAYSGQFIFR
jgi:hypothetical protein